MLGHFNPLIFRPEWFNKKGIIADVDMDAVEIGVIHPDLVTFSLNPWLDISVEKFKFLAQVRQEPCVKLCDFVLNCFSHLPETPMNKIGINRDLHFNLETEDKWHALGDMLAPKEPWGEFLIESSSGKRKGGMLSVAMQQNPRDDGLNGQFRLRVEPSGLPNLRYGACFSFNDHYDLSDDDSLRDARFATDIIKEQWDLSLSRSEQIINSILEKV